MYCMWTIRKRLIVFAMPNYYINTNVMDGDTLCWFKAYLSNRTQAVRVGKVLSDAMPVISGVPQGSVLGPLLFLLYVNDMVDIIPPSVSVKLFADGIKLYSDICTVNDCLVLQNCFRDVDSALNLWNALMTGPLRYK